MSSPTSRPYIDEDGRTDAEKYLEGCLDGTYVVGRHIKKLAEMMLPQIRDGYRNWVWNPEKATRPVRFIEKFCRIPSAEKMGQPFILEPYERMIVELAFGFVDDEGYRRFSEVIVEVGRKNGKGVQLSEELPTPNGWRKMGDLHVGDVIFGQDGKPSTIVAESEVFDKPTYVITFEDGSHFKVTDDHIWTVQTKKARECARNYKPGKTSQSSRRKYRDGGWFEITTQEMFDDPSFVHHRADGKGVEYKYRVPMCLPVKYPEKCLPIDPYTFGAWLGDGTKNKPEITVAIEDMDETLERLLSCGHRCETHNCRERASRVVLDAGVRGVKGSNPFINALKELGVFNNKHIPDMYLQGSVEQRWELLRGLMDTDGYVSKAGQCQFTQKSKMLVEQFVELCSSLGIKANMRSKEARCNGKPAGTVYVVEFWTDKAHSCFHLKRKHDRLKDKLADRMSCKSIVSIERIPNEPTKCIAIDNPSHLYLVGRQYTATHNTSLLAALNLYMLCGDGELAAECYNGATSTNQASLCYGSTQDMKEMSPVLDRNIRYGKIKKRKQMGLNYDKTRSYLCTISGRHKSLDGLNVHLGVLDELAAFTDNGAAYRLLKGSMGSRRQPMLIIISTSNYVRFGIWDKRLAYAKRMLAGEVDDPRLLPILYELDDETEVYDEAMWPKANPGLGTVKSWDYLRDAVNTAKQDPSELPELLSKQFNLPANQEAAFFTYDEACNPATYEFNSEDFRYCVVGIDAADSIDLNCATALFMKKDDPHIYRRSMYWIAEEQVKINIAKEGRDHGAPYHEWAAEGYIRIVPGNKVDRRVFIEWIQELYEEGLYCRAVAHDRYGMKEIEQQLDTMVGRSNVHALAYGPKTLSDPMKKLRADMRSGLIVDNDNPIDHWCNLNVSVVKDTGGNIKPVKKDGPGDRIDGFSALIMAYTILQEEMDDYQVLISD